MLLAIDKPKGITSYDVIRKLKRTFPGEKIGHSGTLDPMATGILIIGVGKGTKQLHEVQGKDKTYEATIDFSKFSDTRDLDYRDIFEEYKIIPLNKGELKGVLIENKEIPAPSLEAIQQKFDQIIGDYILPLPPFSAKKVKGKKRYDLARKGQAEITQQPMTIYKINIIEYTFPKIKIEVEVGSGTYIRSIAYRLGKEFGLGGILTALRRTKIGDVDINKLNLKKDSTELSYQDINTVQ